MTNETKVQKTCPECGYVFRGNGFDGIDAHWRAKHEYIMPYRQAWPLIKAGTYRPRRGTIEAFSGSLHKEGTPRLTIAQIKRITEEAWAGKR
jgi:transposase